MAATVSSSEGVPDPNECTGFICSIRKRISSPSQQVGCGIIVRLKTDKNDTTAGNIISMQKFIKLIPALSKCGAIDSTWILLTSHSVTDGSCHEKFGPGVKSGPGMPKVVLPSQQE